MFVSRGVRPRQATPLERIQLVFYSLFFEWKDVLVVVKPATLIRWHRKLTALNWAFISNVFSRDRRAGRPPIPENLRDLILRIAAENPVWSSRDIAENLREKFGIVVTHNGSPSRQQSWSTFIRNHLSSTIACDFAVVSTLAFKRLYVLVVLELATRRVMHVNVTAHPTAEWTTQQFREAIPAGHGYRFLVHDRDAIFSAGFDDAIRRMGIEPLATPPRSPQANSFVERVIVTLRRGCLDHIIPLGERHLRRKVLEWKDYYNHARPHMSLGGRPPDPPEDLPTPLQPHHHHLPDDATIVARPFLGGLHHDYRLAA
jgi:transposase InsO family protein